MQGKLSAQEENVRQPSKQQKEKMKTLQRTTSIGNHILQREITKN